MQETVTAPEAVDSNALREDAVFHLSPLVRMRNEQGCVEIYLKESKEYPQVHHICGVIFALCSAGRTVREIAHSLAPLLQKNHYEGEQANQEALARVKRIVEYFSRDPQVPLRKSGRKFLAPSGAWLVPPDVLSEFGRMKGPRYEVKSFLPENAYPAARYANSIKRRAPVNVHWHLTSQCQANCRYCLLSRRDIPRDKILPRRRMLEILQECKDIGVIQVLPEGGDILLYPYLFDFLDAYEEHMFMPFNCSTKAYLSKAMARRLGQYNLLHQLQFSIDSTIPDIAEYLTRNPNHYQRTRESVENALEAGIQVVIVKAVLTPYNILTVPRLFREFHQWGARNFRFAPYERSAHHHSEDLYNHDESYTWFEDQLRRLGDEFPDTFVDWQDAPPEKRLVGEEALAKWQETKLGCTAGRSGLVICADGKVMPCDVLPETAEYFLGDLTHQSLQEVWDGDKLNQNYVFYRKEMFEGTPCGTCDNFARCLAVTGYCFQRTFVRTGKVRMTPVECPKYQGPFVRLH